MTHMLNALLHGSELISNQVVQAYFLQALTWSMGAALLEDGRVKLDQYIKYISAMLLIEPSVALAGPGQSVRRYSLDLLICWPAFCHAVHARTHARTHAHTHTHTHQFNGPFSGTTQVSRYQKGKTNLDFTEARNSEWQRFYLSGTCSPG